jgi:hypothetical protein
MAREWEAEFIRLWTGGDTLKQIAAALGIPPGTAQWRAFTLQQEGKIPPRRTRGASPRQNAQARPDGTPAPPAPQVAPAPPMPPRTPRVTRAPRGDLRGGA